MTKERIKESNESLPIVGGGDRRKKCGNGLGVPLDDPRFWPGGRTPAEAMRHALRIPAEGEGEG